MYGQQDLDLQERNGLYEPGVFNGVLHSVEERDTTTQKPILVFSMKAEDGRIFDHTEWPVENGDTKKLKNQMERIGIIMSRFVDKSKITNMTGVSDWLSYRRFVINTLGNSYKNVPITFKLVPNNYDEDNPRVQFPLYKGGLVLQNSERELKLSKNEEEEVVKYKKLLAKKLGNEENAGSMPSVTEQATAAGYEATPNNGAEAQPEEESELY